MRARAARRLHNRDKVEARVAPGQWSPGYVLGEPTEADGRVSVPVVTDTDGFLIVDHTDVR